MVSAGRFEQMMIDREAEYNVEVTEEMILLSDLDPLEAASLAPFVGSATPIFFDNVNEAATPHLSATIQSEHIGSPLFGSEPTPSACIATDIQHTLATQFRQRHRLKLRGHPPRSLIVRRDGDHRAR